MLNIRDTAKTFLAQLKKNGFNGLRFQTELEGSDEPEPDEETIEQKAEFNRNYAIFIARPEWPFTDFDDAPYTETVVHEDRFWKEFKTNLLAVFGSDVEIRINKGLGEIEIQRKSKSD